MTTPTKAIYSPCYWRQQSQFEDNENIMAQSPRKRLRLPSVFNMATNVTFQQHKVTREDRSNVLGRYSGYRGCTLWFTGLSGAGKTTIAFALEKTLIKLGIPSYSLDGDNVRHGLCRNLGFSKTDRAENIRRVGEVAKLFGDSGMVVLASFISPFKVDRDFARRIHEQDNIPFFEIYINTSLEICEARDPKKLYKKARAGEIKEFTGVDSAYEPPLEPDLILNSGEETEIESIQKVFNFLYEKKILPEEAMYQLCGQPIRQLFEFNKEEQNKLIEEIGNNLNFKIEISEIDLQWIQVLAEGWASPLAGFMRERQYLQCLHFGQIFDLKKKCQINGERKEGELNCDEEENDGEDQFPMLGPINQTIPIVLPIFDNQANLIKSKLSSKPKIQLIFKNKLIGILKDIEIFPHRKKERIHRQFGHFVEEKEIENGHPGIKLIMESGDWLVGGDLKVFERIIYNDGLDEYRKTPSELKQIFEEKQCDCVFAFQLRNPIHNGHALLMSKTREELLLKGYKNPMLLLHPLGGWTKDDDVPLNIRIKQHLAVLENGIINKEWTILSIFPSPMCYAGPTEVQWHARARLTCGVDAYIVGRDPAGIADNLTGDSLYEPSHGAKVLSMAPALPGLEIIPFQVAAYDKKAGCMAFFDEKRSEDFQFISGTMIRKLAKEGKNPPKGFMPENAWKIIASYYQNL
uniref:Uncharacterized protein n=1 Tax=Meloidogyne enterolobii TaxID=390850 RepID=A0A6V7XK95_MELEN|nr:unnamed protein product [Meloidogyne enterolobii]